MSRMTSVLSYSSSLPPHLHSPAIQPAPSASYASAAVAAVMSSTVGLAQPAMMRGASAPKAIATHYTHRSKARPVVQAKAVAVAAEAAAAAAPMVAHVLQDVADQELSKRLQSRLATLGIGANTVKVEVRANSSAEGGAGNGRSFTLTVSGKLSVNLGSLFNILIYGFLKQHPQITSIERRVTFVQNGEGTNNAASSTAQQEPKERCVDSAPILALKVKHVVKLLSASTHAVVYVGDHLLQGSQLPSTTGMTAPGSTPPSDAPILTELSAPNPPVLLAKWVKEGVVKHIINENTEGWFNPKSNKLGGAGNMSDDEVSSVHSGSSCSSLDEIDEPLSSDHLSELYGNKFKEVCSSGCGGIASGASVYFRDFEVRQPRFLGRISPSSSPANPLSSSADAHLTGRTCTYCNAPLRDTLVDWNESLPRAVLQKSVSQAAAADLSLVFGSTLKVAPTCDMPQLSSPSAPMILVSPFPTGKDIEALESGGVLIRKEPVFVLDALQKEREVLLASTSSPQPVAAKIVRKGSSSSGRATLAIPRAVERTESGSSASYTRATALTKTWSKSSHPHGMTSAQVQVQQAKKTQAHLLQFAQRRGAPINHGGLARPSLARSATAPNAGMMRLSASLPPFPKLDDMSDGAVPAASAPSRACSEQPSPRVFPGLALGAPIMQHTPMPMGPGHLLFPSSLPDMNLPSLPTVSSPIFVSRGNSLSPPHWPGISTPVAQAAPVQKEDEDGDSTME